MINYKEFIKNAESYVGRSDWHYLYGYKGEEISRTLNAEFEKLYPRIWGQSNYQTKSREWIGQRAVDCSGLIFLASDKDARCLVNSSTISAKWSRIKTPRAGAIGWRSGHVVIVKEVRESDIIIIESAGIEAGIRERVAAVSEFKKYVLCPAVDYAEEGNKYQIGWNKDDRGWWYSPDGTNYLANGYYKLSWSKNSEGDWFYFDSEGWLITTDSNSVIKEPKIPRN